MVKLDPVDEGVRLGKLDGCVGEEEGDVRAVPSHEVEEDRGVPSSSEGEAAPVSVQGLRRSGPPSADSPGTSSLPSNALPISLY